MFPSYIEQLVYVACVHVVMGTHYIHVVHTGVHDVHALLLDGQKVGHFLITIQKSFKLIINQLWT